MWGAALVAAAATVLTSCSAAGMTPGSAVSSAAGPVQDPSIPSAAPTASVAAPDTPAPAVPSAVTVAPTATASADARTAVVPAITTPGATAAAGSLRVAAIVTGIVESGGSCVATLTSGSATRTAVSHGVAAGSYTGCEAVTFSNVTAGSWQVRVRYESSKAVGSSAAHVVQVG
ncbi:MAG: hypothetical protein HIU86_02905 [Acidobacteria bacterium]|nr:hypothetical protein [Acidobacteriota bacterium]